MEHYSTVKKYLKHGMRQHPILSSYLKCGRLEYGFLRVQCETCHGEQLVAFSCKRRGFYPSCGAKRMVESAALLVDEVLPEKPIRQWVLSVPYPLRWLFAAEPEMMSKALLIVTRAISSYWIQKTAIDVPKECGEHRSKMSWAMRLKRVFNIDITVCRHCQGRVRIIARIEERAVIDKIVAHRNQQQQSQTSVQVSSCIRAPPMGQSGQMTMNY